MSADLVWMLTRKQNCFIRQKKGSGGDQLVRPRARANRFVPPRSSMALGLLRRPLGVPATVIMSASDPYTSVEAMRRHAEGWGAAPAPVATRTVDTPAQDAKVDPATARQP